VHTAGYLFGIFWLRFACVNLNDECGFILFLAAVQFYAVLNVLYDYFYNNRSFYAYKF